MSNTKHTPGPWRLQHVGGHDDNRFVMAARGNICQMDGGPNDDEQVYANARLIAAAPELLKELQQAYNVICYAAQEAKGKVKKEIVGGWLYHARKIDLLIAKAEGRE